MRHRLRFQKRPGEDKTFTVGLEDFLDTDTISSVASTVPSGITESGAAAANGGAVTIRGVQYPANTLVQFSLSGGTEGDVYIYALDVTTAAGDLHQFDIAVEIVADYDAG